jgi:hypothetical protein
MDNRVEFHVEKQIQQALSALKIASDHVNDTGNIEDDELDAISSLIKSTINKVEFYLGKF